MKAKSLLPQIYDVGNSFMQNLASLCNFVLTLIEIDFFLHFHMNEYEML